MSRTIAFVKMSGGGNDFVMVDNREGILSEEELVPFTQYVCPRRTAVGADGAIFLEPADEEAGLDFRMRYINADGSEADMCGNGARCIASFAASLDVAGKEMRFATLAGPIGAWVGTNGGTDVKIEMTEPSGIESRSIDENGGEAKFLDTGVPHAVVFVDDVTTVDVRKEGRNLRNHQAFAPAGANANFVQLRDDGLKLRTYERGVEDETLACGTGAVAAALCAANDHGRTSPLPVEVASGETLTIHFEGEGPKFRRAYLEGPAVVVYKATIEWAGI